MIEARDRDVIAAEGRRIIAIGRGAPDAVVPQYPTWSLTDLVVHLAGVHGRTASVCRELPQDRISRPTRPDDADPFDWAEAQLEGMLEAMATADGEAHVWTFVADPRLAFWGRRMVIETGVHRWDAQGALGQPEPLLDLVATHGLDEFDQLYRPRLDVPPLELRATDVDRAWRFGAGAPEAVVEATASELFLRLMSRPGAALPPAWAAAVDALAPPPN